MGICIIYIKGRQLSIIKKRQRSLGDDLLFRPVTREVPSALESLTAGFGMGPGVPSPLISPSDL